MKNLRTLLSSIAIFLIVLWGLLVPSAASAVPAYPGRTWLTLADGTRIEATLQGDEYGYRYVTDDGRVILPDTQGRLNFATAAQTQAWQVRTAAARAAANVRRAEHSPRLKGLRPGATGVTEAPTRVDITGEPYAFEGTRRGLVILANFADSKFTYSRDDMERMLNEPGYSTGGGAGSLHDYFYDQSYGKFDFEFDVVGPVELSQPYAYYGADGEWGIDTYKVDMIIEAAVMADRDGIDYTQYDWDGDGEIELIFVIYAGYGQHYTGNDADYLWPSSGCIYPEVEYRLDDRLLNTIACSSELDGTESVSVRRMAGIGTLAHEFSHCFGLPDLYATMDTHIDQSQGAWDVMCSGNYNGGNAVPCGFSAYERWLCGWLDFTDLTEPTSISGMPAIDVSPVAYRMVNPANPYEYFVMENRSADKWFEFYANRYSVPGLLVTHVDYWPTMWKENTVNSYDHERVGLVRASNDPTRYIFDGLNTTAWNGLSHYNNGAMLYTAAMPLGTFADIDVQHISRSADGLISFDYDKLSNQGVGEGPVPAVTDLKLSPRANGRINTRQPVVATLSYTGDKTYYDYVSLPYCLIPDGVNPEVFAADPTEELTFYSDPVPVTFNGSDAEQSLTLSFYMMPRKAGYYYVALQGALSGHLGHTILAFGVTLPDGIDGIEVDAPAPRRSAKRTDGHRVTIVRNGQRYDISGRALDF